MSDAEKPLIAQKEPYATDVVAGETYYWCACGKSKSQPFCDGSHQDGPFEPVAFTAEKTETVYLVVVNRRPCHRSVMARTRIFK